MITGLIYDRTAEDVAFARRIAERIRAGEELTAEELAQLDRHNKKREPGGVTAPTSPAR